MSQDFSMSLQCLLCSICSQPACGLLKQRECAGAAALPPHQHTPSAYLIRIDVTWRNRHICAIDALRYIVPWLWENLFAMIRATGIGIHSWPDLTIVVVPCFCR